MQNCLGELNRTYCLVYLDDTIVFLKTEEEHLHHLHIVFQDFREHHLKLKPTKCKFFKSKINYLAHHISKDTVWPSKENLKAVAEFTPPQTLHQKLGLFGLNGTLKVLYKSVSSHCATTAWVSFWRRGQQEEQVSNTHGRLLSAFKALKKAYLEGPVLDLLIPKSRFWWPSGGWGWWRDT